MSYRAFRGFVMPARAAPQLWRLVAGLALVAAVTVGLGQAVLALARLLLPDAAAWELIADVETGRGVAGGLLLLLTTGALWVGAVLAAQMLHHRSGRSLLGPLPLLLPQGARVLRAVVLVFALIAVLPPYDLLAQVQPGLPPLQWLLLLPLSLSVLLIQVTAEEVLFRGYLTQQLGARFASPLIWMGLPSALFALGHYAPGVYGANAGWVALWAFAFGLAATDLTARSGTLGPAIALHLANNASAILILAPQGALSGLALFRLPFGPGDEAALGALLPAEFGTLLIGWLAARLALRR